MRPDPRTEAEVKELLARIVGAAGRRDAGAAIAMFADDRDVFLFGTGVDEARKGPAEIRGVSRGRTECTRYAGSDGSPMNRGFPRCPARAVA